MWEQSTCGFQPYAAGQSSLDPAQDAGGIVGAGILGQHALGGHQPDLAILNANLGVRRILGAILPKQRVVARHIKVPIPDQLPTGRQTAEEQSGRATEPQSGRATEPQSGRATECRGMRCVGVWVCGYRSNGEWAEVFSFQSPVSRLRSPVSSHLCSPLEPPDPRRNLCSPLEPPDPRRNLCSPLEPPDPRRNLDRRHSPQHSNQQALKNLFHGTTPVGGSQKNTNSLTYGRHHNPPPGSRRTDERAGIRQS